MPDAGSIPRHLHQHTGNKMATKFKKVKSTAGQGMTKRAKKTPDPYPKAAKVKGGKKG